MPKRSKNKKTKKSQVNENSSTNEEYSEDDIDDNDLDEAISQQEETEIRKNNEKVLKFVNGARRSPRLHSQVLTNSHANDVQEIPSTQAEAQEETDAPATQPKSKRGRKPATITQTSMNRVVKSIFKEFRIACVNVTFNPIIKTNDLTISGSNLFPIKFVAISCYSACRCS